MTRRAGIGHWHAHEGRHTAVSTMSSNGVPIQDISDTVGHKSTHVSETVYRHVIVTAIRGGASVMDSVFRDHDADDASCALSIDGSDRFRSANDRFTYAEAREERNCQDLWINFSSGDHCVMGW